MRAPRASARGSSLLEVLISMALLALALLGAAMMSVQALKLNQGGRYRAQAVVLSDDIAERIEANKDGAIAGAYALAANAAASSAKNCTAAPCSSAELAGYDLADWVTRASQALPDANWTITTVAVGNPATYQIDVGWRDRSATPGSSSTRTERYSYTTVKTIYR